MYEIKNIKLSVKIDNLNFSQVKESLKESSNKKNFIVVKDIYTYILFKPRLNETVCHLNITKVPSFCEIDLSIHVCEQIFQKQVLYNTLRIDNITCVQYLNKILSLPILYKQLSKNNILKYNSDIFPGLIWRAQVGTAIIFHSGKVVIVGCNEVCQIETITKQIEDWIIKRNYGVRELPYN